MPFKKKMAHLKTHSEIASEHKYQNTQAGAGEHKASFLQPPYQFLASRGPSTERSIVGPFDDFTKPNSGIKITAEAFLKRNVQHI